MKREFRFVANKVYMIPGRGVVVTGRVEKGTVSVGGEIGFIGTDGQYVSATVVAIEVARRLVEEAQAGQEASLLLEGVRKDQVTQGTVFMEAPEAPPVPVTSPQPQTAPAQMVTPPPVPPSPRPIAPSSGLARSIVFILVGLLILLALLISQGKVDPKKWDPRRKRASVQYLAISSQQSALSGFTNAPIRDR